MTDDRQAMDAPQLPPEARLIRLVREAAGIKIADAAQRAGISKARWSQVESGFEMRFGRRKPVRARDGTLAHMAAAIGLSPSRLEEAGRPLAAEVLREMQDGTQERPRFTDPVLERIWQLPGLSEEERESLIALVNVMRERRRNNNGRSTPPRRENGAPA